MPTTVLGGTREAKPCDDAMQSTVSNSKNSNSNQLNFVQIGSSRARRGEVMHLNYNQRKVPLHKYGHRL